MIVHALPASLRRRGLQHDDRDLSGRVPRVVGEAWVRSLLRVPDALPLVPRGHSGDQVDRLGADLRSYLRMGEQVVVPVGVGGSAALGREDGIASVHILVHHRVYPGAGQSWRPRYAAVAAARRRTGRFGRAGSMALRGDRGVELA